LRTGTNAVEGHKASKDGNALAIREDLPSIIARGHEGMTAAEKDLLKWLGVFFRNPTPGRFMMRIRMPNGFTNVRQVRAIADVSRRMGNCVVDITTRQQIQVRGFTLSSVPRIWQKCRPAIC
jgi:ferredoxin-nitrite reductase